jgi:hypothetical protein
MGKVTKPKAVCAVCGFEETRGRCRKCGRPICDGCAQRARNRVCLPCASPFKRPLANLSGSAILSM